ncbi:hypothetical protein DFJ73DRAFT_821731 [Zopfochytrium polystomum]|nr:hypothetical protein DFJ73DRAFT_821731 [Zopfochytrium polystomum]
MGLPTPETGHLRERQFRDVYDPAEDTFLLLDALEADREYLTSTVDPLICLEIGSGSGCVITFLNLLLKKSSTVCFSTDINGAANRATTITASKNDTTSPVEAVNCLFAEPLARRLARSVDVLIFNPPYVVTPSSEVGSTGIEAAWAGGIDGREVIDQFLAVPDALLSDRGALYLVTVKENRPDEIAAIFREKYGLESKIVARRSVGIEGLSIMRVSRGRTGGDDGAGRGDGQ